MLAHREELHTEKQLNDLVAAGSTGSSLNWFSPVHWNFMNFYLLRTEIIQETFVCYTRVIKMYQQS